MYWIVELIYLIFTYTEYSAEHIFYKIYEFIYVPVQTYNSTKNLLDAGYIRVLNRLHISHMYTTSTIEFDFNWLMNFLGSKMEKNYINFVFKKKNKQKIIIKPI